MSELFGTDGVRGIPGRYPLAPDTVRRLGYAAASILAKHLPPARRDGSGNAILLGRDTRSSGKALGQSLAEGFALAGYKTVDIGVVPTPAVSYLVPRRGALCGAVISASHNPAEFNGIKFFTRDGYKMAPFLEKEIERLIAELGDEKTLPPRMEFDAGGEEDYLDFLRSTFPPTLDLSGVRLVVDCANGSACRIGPRLFRDLGAEVFSLGCSPNGANINRECGALDTRAMSDLVVQRKCFAGISLDGDADRAILADSSGRILDGDALIAMAAADMQDRGCLSNNGVVLTVMSNFGLVKYLEARGIRVTTVPVGDRNVTEALEREDLSLGGEASGHIVFRRFAPTGDGLLTALQILSILARSKKSLKEYRQIFKVYPQILKNVPARTKVPLERLPRLQAKIRECEEKLKGRGRVLVRYSGTEPLIRFMLEGPERGALQKMFVELNEVFRKESQDHVH